MAAITLLAYSAYSSFVRARPLIGFSPRLADDRSIGNANHFSPSAPAFGNSPTTANHPPILEYTCPFLTSRLPT